MEISLKERASDVEIFQILHSEWNLKLNTTLKRHETDIDANLRRLV